VKGHRQIPKTMPEAYAGQQGEGGLLCGSGARGMGEISGGVEMAGGAKDNSLIYGNPRTHRHAVHQADGRRRWRGRWI